MAAAGPHRLPARRTPGFTLLELLVVLVVLGSLAGLVAPALLRAADAARLRGARHDLTAALEALPVRAFGGGKPLEVGAAELRAQFADWPADWRLTMAEPLRYGASGVAAGGQLQLRQGAGPQAPLLRLRVAAVTGDVSVVEADDE